MDRRSFIAAGGGLAAMLPGMAAAARHKMPLVSSYVTNVAETAGRGALPVRAGDAAELRLVERAYDPDSVMVLSPQGVPLGYLPTNQTRLIAPLMRAGMRLPAAVTESREGDRPAIRISISLDA